MRLVAVKNDNDDAKNKMKNDDVEEIIKILVKLSN